MIDAALACGRADHLQFWEELSPEEWDWLEAYRHVCGLPEDRLRGYFAVLIHSLTLWLTPGDESISIAEAERLLDPYRHLKDRSQPQGGPDAVGDVMEVSPDQAAAMSSIFFGQHGVPGGD